jgi:hypothetical protein
VQQTLLGDLAGSTKWDAEKQNTNGTLQDRRTDSIFQSFSQQCLFDVNYILLSLSRRDTNLLYHQSAEAMTDEEKWPFRMTLLNHSARIVHFHAGAMTILSSFKLSSRRSAIADKVVLTGGSAPLNQRDSYPNVIMRAVGSFCGSMLTS